MNKLENYINSNYSLEDEYYKIFGRRIPTGKFSCPNPSHLHQNNTPSCKVYGNVFKCFGQCNRIFGVYDLWKWYSPQNIKEVKSTVIINSSTEGYKTRVVKVSIDRSKSVKVILEMICNSLHQSS